MELKDRIAIIVVGVIVTIDLAFAVGHLVSSDSASNSDPIVGTWQAESPEKGISSITIDKNRVVSGDCTGTIDLQEEDFPQDGYSFSVTCKASATEVLLRGDAVGDELVIITDVSTMYLTRK